MTVYKKITNFAQPKKRSSLNASSTHGQSLTIKDL